MAAKAAPLLLSTLRVALDLVVIPLVHASRHNLDIS